MRNPHEPAALARGRVVRRPELGDPVSGRRVLGARSA